MQNFLDSANYQYYSVFPEQLRGQSAQWWEARAAGRRLSPELTCLLIRICAVSAQYLEPSLKQRLELELGEKAQSMTERLHAAAKRLSASVPRGSGGVIQVQQLFLEASWYKSEAHVVESWHALSASIREAQEIGRWHKLSSTSGRVITQWWSALGDRAADFRAQACTSQTPDSCPLNVSCAKECGVSSGPGTGEPRYPRLEEGHLINNQNRQMSTLLSRPLLIDQDNHVLEIPDGRLENIHDVNVPHPLSSVALQATLGVHVSHLFQKMASGNSLELVLQIEDALEKWMGTFPAALRDHRPDTRWDAKFPTVPFMRAQVNVIAYCYLLAPLKPYLLGSADPKMMSSPLGDELRLKGVDTCLDLMRASEKFYDLIFPQSIKYFFIIFFMFDAATVMCSAIVHDVNNTLPKRAQCVRSLRTAQELLDNVAHLSENARISAQLLRKLCATLPLSHAEKQTLGLGDGGGASAKKIKKSSSPDRAGSGINPRVAYGFQPIGKTYGDRSDDMSSSSSMSLPRSSTAPSTISRDSCELAYAGARGFSTTTTTMTTTTNGVAMMHGGGPAAASHWGMGNFGLGPTQHEGGLAGFNDVDGGVGMMVPTQLGDSLSGTFLDPLWDWDRLNMDFSQFTVPR